VVSGSFRNLGSGCSCVPQLSFFLTGTSCFCIYPFLQVLKRLMGAVVALVLRREDLRCRLLKSIARELLTCSVLLPALNFASPG
jgi:hypothetical protein